MSIDDTRSAIDIMMAEQAAKDAFMDAEAVNIANRGRLAAGAVDVSIFADELEAHEFDGNAMMQTVDRMKVQKAERKKLPEATDTMGVMAVKSEVLMEPIPTQPAKTSEFTVAA